MDSTQDPIEDEAPAQDNARNKNKRKTRGPCTMPRLTKERSQEQRRRLDFNNKGQPIGKNAITFANYLGSLARINVPITHKDWEEVPKDVKDKIWSCLQKQFEVDDSYKKQFLSSAGTKWKNFKYRLNKDFILPFKDDPEALKTPPAMYDFIHQEDWEIFVQYRLSEEFERTSNEYKRRKAEDKIPHHVSRKGYANLEVEIQQSVGSMEAIERAVLWRVAREGKQDGFKSSTVKEIVEKIDILMKQRDDGLITTSGHQDILAMALEKTESRGRVRGVGQFVTPKSYFGRGKKACSHDKGVTEYISQLDKHFKKNVQDSVKEYLSSVNLEDLMRDINFLKNPSEHGSCNVDQPLHDNEANTKNMFVEDDREMEDIPDKIFNNDIENVQNQLVATLDKVKSCQLALGTIGNIVASGIVFESMNKNATIHGVPLASTDVRVAIEVPIKRDAVLPRPIDDELVFLHQAVGTHVAWPKRLVVLVDKEGDKQMPTRIASILKYADRVMENNIGLEIKLEADFIAKTSGKTYLMKSDILELCKMQKIGAAVIICYMRLLYDKIKVNKLNLGLKFCNPEDSGRNLGNRARALAERFQMLRPKQLGIFPYNKSKHWMLIIIDPHESIVYLFDPLGQYPLKDLEAFIPQAIMIFHTAIGKSTRKTIGWEKMDCPRQPSNFECGYYVMRYMKDIIENKNASISNKFSKKSSYSKEEIDEVREELAEYIWSKCI